MEQSKVNEFIQKHSKSFPTAQQADLKQKLEQTPDEKFDKIMKTGYKGSGALITMAVLFPGFGIDRFSTGSAGLGILRIVSYLVYAVLFIALSKHDDILPLPALLLPWITFIFYIGASVTFSVGNLGIIALVGGLTIFIWYAVELATIGKRVKNHNYKKLGQILMK